MGKCCREAGPPAPPEAFSAVTMGRGGTWVCTLPSRLPGPARSRQGGEVRPGREHPHSGQHRGARRSGELAWGTGQRRAAGAERCVEHRAAFKIAGRADFSLGHVGVIPLPTDRPQKAEPGLLCKLEPQAGPRAPCKASDHPSTSRKRLCTLLRDPGLREPSRLWLSTQTRQRERLVSSIP